jgi:signal transduction histidine kinase
MGTADFLILVFASLANITLGLFSLFKNSKNITNRLFAILTFTLVGWTTASYISLNLDDSGQTFSALRAILVFVVLQNTFYFLFITSYRENRLNLKKGSTRAYIAFSLMTFLLSVYPTFFASYQISGDSISPNPRPIIGLFMLHALVSIAGGIISLSKQHAHSNGAKRNQYRYLMLASAVLLFIAPVANFILPIAFNIQTLIPYSPLYTLGFSILITYAIIRHHLFDIKAAIARSVAYVLALGFIGLVYGSIIYIVAELFSSDDNFGTGDRALYVAFAILSALIFPTVKAFFDRITNRIFYRDAYDPQVFLDELNTALVRNIELRILLRQTTEIIHAHLKPEFCVTVVVDCETQKTTVIGTGEANIDEQVLERVFMGMNHLKSDVLITEELGAWKLQHLLSDNGIGIVKALRSSAATDGPTAYLVLGAKKSGNIYSQSDKQIIDIIGDELVIAIQNALRFEEIQGFAATLQAKVNEATAKLKRTNEQLKEMDDTKDEFISMASHQLRTPLTSVKGYLSMVLEGDAGKITDQQAELLGQAFASSQRMVYLIADLLNVSRLKTGKFVIDAAPTNLAEMVESEIAQLREQAKSKNLKLIYHKPADFPEVMLDETKIRQVIMNFADNAIYYTPSGGSIKIELNNDHGNVYFRVIDNGLGVPLDEQKHLFTKFYRAKNARKARPDGTGLGLFMAKKVISAQGGTLLFESQEGKGSTFGFAFQKSKLAKSKK